MERELIESLQKGIAELKTLTGDMGKTANALAKLTRDAGRYGAGNAAMHLEGQMDELRGKVKQIHASATDAMLEYFPEFAAEVIMRGPPR